MSSPPGDDASPEATEPAIPAASRRAQVARPHSDETQAPAAPPQPDTRFAPPSTSAGPPAEPAPTGRLLTRLVIGMIGAASLLLLSLFLPWATWHLPDTGAGIAVSAHSYHGLDVSESQVVMVAGMAALALAIAAKVVSRRFAVYTAIPGGLSLATLLRKPDQS
jgi:hypothetical protein